MALTINTPGIRNIVTTDTLSNAQTVEKTIKPGDVRQSTASEEEQSTQNNQRRIAKQAYQNVIAKTEREPAIKAHQIMVSPVITITPNTVLTAAWRIFREKRFRHIPVINPDKTLFGILSDRHLLRYAAVSGRIPPYPDGSIESTTPISPLTKTNVTTTGSDTTIRSIAQTLFEQHIGAMPIVNDRNQLIGIITRSDILRTLINQAPLQLWV